jgi:hypothetical protein
MTLRLLMTMLAAAITACSPLSPGPGGGDFTGAGPGNVRLEGLHLGGSSAEPASLQSPVGWHFIGQMALCHEVGADHPSAPLLLLLHRAPPQFQAHELVVVGDSGERRTFHVERLSAHRKQDNLESELKIPLTAEDVQWLAAAGHTLQIALRDDEHQGMALLRGDKMLHLRYYDHVWVRQLPAESFAGQVDRIDARHPETHLRLEGVSLGRADGRILSQEQAYIAQMTLCRVVQSGEATPPYRLLVRLAAPAPMYTRTVTLTDQEGRSRTAAVEDLRQEEDSLGLGFLEEFSIPLSADDVRWITVDPGLSTLRFHGIIIDMRVPLNHAQKRNLKLFDHLYVRGLPRREFNGDPRPRRE